MTYWSRNGDLSIICKFWEWQSVWKICFRAETESSILKVRESGGYLWVQGHPDRCSSRTAWVKYIERPYLKKKKKSSILDMLRSKSECWWNAMDQSQLLCYTQCYQRRKIPCSVKCGYVTLIFKCKSWEGSYWFMLNSVWFLYSDVSKISSIYLSPCQSSYISKWKQHIITEINNTISRNQNGHHSTYWKHVVLNNSRGI